METKKTYPKSSLFSRTTWIFIGILALAIVGAVIFIRAADTVDPQVTSMALTYQKECAKLYDRTLAFDMPILSVNHDPSLIALRNRDGTKFSSADVVTINRDGSLSIFFDQNNLPVVGNTYTLIIPANYLLDPANTRDINYTFTVTCGETPPTGCPVTLDDQNNTYRLFTCIWPLPVHQVAWTIVFENNMFKSLIAGELEFSIDSINWKPEIDLSGLRNAPLYVRSTEFPDASHTSTLTITSASCDLLGCSVTFMDPCDVSCQVTDTDGDGISDNEDNCVYVYNPDQTNTDGGTVTIHKGETYVFNGITLTNVGDCNLTADAPWVMAFTEPIHDGTSPIRINPSPKMIVENMYFYNKETAQSYSVTYPACREFDGTITFEIPGDAEGDACDCDDDICTEGYDVNRELICPLGDPACGEDSDGDGISDNEDNCVYVYNPGQENMDPGFMIGHNYQVMIDRLTGLPIPVDMPLSNGSIVTWDGLLKLSSTDSELSRDGMSRSNSVTFETAGENLGSVYVRNNKTALITEMLTISIISRSTINFFTIEGEGDNVGDACDCDDKICTEGYDVNGKLICPKGDPACVVDSDGDGIPDDEDECVYVPGKIEFYGCPSRLRVSVEEIDASTKPASHIDDALITKVFDANPGSCAYNIGVQVQNYEDIWNKCDAENTKKETYSPNDGGNKPRNLISDLVGLGVTRGTKLVLVKSLMSVDGTYGYMGFDLPDMVDGESRDVGFNIVPGQPLNFVQISVFTKNTKGLRQSSRRAQVIQGTELEIFQPDYVLWNGIEEIYPFAFIADGDRTVDVCMEVPAGYEIVEPGSCTQELIQNEIKIIEFKALDVGSPKEFDAKVKMKIKHKGKTHNVDLNIKSFNPKVKASVWEKIKDLFRAGNKNK